MEEQAHHQLTPDKTKKIFPTLKNFSRDENGRSKNQGKPKNPDFRPIMSHEDQHFSNEVTEKNLYEKFDLDDTVCIFLNPLSEQLFI